MMRVFRSSWVVVRCLGISLVLSIGGCGGAEPSPLLLVSLSGVPEGTATLRATSYLNDVQEQEPAVYPKTVQQFLVRLPSGAKGRYRIEAEALAEDGCSFAVGTAESEVKGEERLDILVPFSKPMEFRSCTLNVRKQGAGDGYVESDPQSIYCGLERSKCAGLFQQGVTVTLVATARTGSAFEGFGGACLGTGPCKVVLTGSKMVTATFGIKIP